MFCPKCGEQIPDDSTFCPVCGQKISDSMADDNSTSDEEWDTGHYSESENTQSDYEQNSTSYSYENVYREGNDREPEEDFQREFNHQSDGRNGGRHRKSRPALIVLAMVAVAALAVCGTLLVQNHSITEVSTKDEETAKSVSTTKKSAEDKNDTSEKTTAKPSQSQTTTPTKKPTISPTESPSPAPTVTPSPTQAPQVIVVTPSATPEPTAPPTVIYTNDDYIFPYSDTYLLTDADLAGKSAWELTVGRNEIAARHGYVFNREDLQDYFNSKDWYYPTGKFDLNTVLSSTELRNMSFIDKYQNAHGLQTS